MEIRRTCSVITDNSFSTISLAEQLLKKLSNDLSSLVLPVYPSFSASVIAKFLGLLFIDHVLSVEPLWIIARLNNPVIESNSIPHINFKKL